MTAGARAIGIVEDPSAGDPARLATAVEAAGAQPHVDDPTALGSKDLDAVIAVGSQAFRSVADQSDVPILPLDVDSGLPSVAVDDLQSAVASVLVGDATTEPVPVLAVDADGESALAFREVTMITAEPARISEFAIDHDGRGHLDTVRADGVVVATPAGSAGYAGAGDGPLLEPGTGLTVVPIAPFRTDRDRWVVPLGGVSVRVQRDEAAVTVETDGDVLATVGRDAEVTMTPTGKLGVLVVPESVRRPR